MKTDEMIALPDFARKIPEITSHFLCYREELRISAVEGAIPARIPEKRINAYSFPKLRHALKRLRISRVAFSTSDFFHRRHAAEPAPALFQIDDEGTYLPFFLECLIPFLLYSPVPIGFAHCIPIGMIPEFYDGFIIAAVMALRFQPQFMFPEKIRQGAVSFYVQPFQIVPGVIAVKHPTAPQSILQSEPLRVQLSRRHYIDSLHSP